MAEAMHARWRMRTKTSYDGFLPSSQSYVFNSNQQLIQVTDQINFFL